MYLLQTYNNFNTFNTISQKIIDVSMKQHQNTNLIFVTIVTFHVFTFVICKSADRYYRACRLIFLCMPFTISMLIILYLYACRTISLCLSYYISMLGVS